jgi:outer membrane protein
VPLAGAPGAGEVARLAVAGGGESSPELVIEQALTRRSDLRQIELFGRLRETELRLEQAEYLPKVALFGTYGINAQQSGSPAFFGQTGSDRAYGRQVGVSVTMPLFAGFGRPARVSQRTAAVRQVETQRRLALAQAEHQVRTLLDQYREAAERAEAQKLAVVQAQRGYQIVSTQYREGISSHLEVTDAEVALRQSEFYLAEAIYDYLAAQARLDAAVGEVPLVDTDMRVARTSVGSAK